MMKKISVYRVQLVKQDAFDFENDYVRAPRDAEEISRTFLHHEFGGDPDREVFGILWLNTKNRVTALEISSIGSLNASIVHPREVFKSGILHNACSFVCFHNHPSGDPSPSPEDIRITTRLKECGDLLGINFMDHIVLGEDRFISLKEQGLV